MDFQFLKRSNPVTTVETASDARPPVGPIDWTGIRRVYKKMQDDFWLITQPFGIELDDDTRLYLAHLIATIDSIDRTLDDLPQLEQRSQLGRALVDFLRGTTETIESDWVIAEVQQRMTNLRNAIILQNVREEFCDTVQSVFIHTEAKRAAKTEREMISQMREEWRLTGHLTLLVMGQKSTPQFASFFYRCCEMMTAVDMIQDAIQDYRDGQISVRPWPSLYLRLLAEFLIPLPGLVWQFPKRLNLLRYTFSFLWHVYGPGRTD